MQRSLGGLPLCISTAASGHTPIPSARHGVNNWQSALTKPYRRAVMLLLTECSEYTVKTRQGLESILIEFKIPGKVSRVLFCSSARLHAVTHTHTESCPVQPQQQLHWNRRLVGGWVGKVGAQGQLDGSAAEGRHYSFPFHAYIFFFSRSRDSNQNPDQKSAFLPSIVSYVI